MNEMHHQLCQSIEPLLSAYLLGELDTTEKANVSAHLTTCASCRAELETLRSTVDLVARTSPGGLSLSDAGRAQLVAQARSARARRRPVLAYSAAALAAAAVIVVGLSPFWNPPAEERPTPAASGAPAVASAPAVATATPGAGAPDALTGPVPADGVAAPATPGATPAGVGLQEERLLAMAPELAAGLESVQAPRDAPQGRAVFPRFDRDEIERRHTEYGELRKVDDTGVTPTTDALSGALGVDGSQARTRSLEQGEAPGGAGGGFGGARARGASGVRRETGIVGPSPDGGSRRNSYKAELPAPATPGKVETLFTDPAAEPTSRDLAWSDMPEPAKQAGRQAGANRFVQGQAAGLRPPAVPGQPRGPEVEQRVKSAELVVNEEKEAARKTDSWSFVLKDPGETADLKRQAENAPAAEADKKQDADRSKRAAISTVEPANKPEAAGPLPGADRAVSTAPAPTQLTEPAEAPARDTARAANAAKAEEFAKRVQPLAEQTVARGWRVEVDDILTALDRRTGETPNMMLFRFWGDNPFVEAATDSLSTFGADVDTASYSLFRNYLAQQGVLPPKEAVRTEEFVNYFRGRYAPPTEDGRAFAVHTDCAPSPFAHEPEYKLLRIGVKGREVSREKRKACSLVFVIDTSGSMRQGNRLETVKSALRLLVNELDEGDTIGVVAFDFEAREILAPAPASARERILDAIAQLEPRRNTNVAAGLALGYSMAASRLIPDGSNRVILLSDGVANTGVTDAPTMLAQVATERQRGIYLTTVGVGMGNLNDALLSELADRGNGQCVYVDRVEEAKRVFVDNLTGTLEAIARDMKLQVEFDPAKVLRYRLLGYEKRAIADADFRNNAVDAGEIGAGHEVTALYELKLKPDATGRYATVRVRHLTVEHGEAQEVAVEVDAGAIKPTFGDAPPRYRLHACAAELAEVLRESYWARGGSLERVASLLKEQMDVREREGGPALSEDPDVVELLALVTRADALVRKRLAEQTDVARAMEALKENVYLGARVEDELVRRQDQNRSQLDEIRRRNEELRRQLESLLSQ